MSTNAPTLADVVLTRVTARTDRRVRDLQVVVGPDRVTLRGRVNSFHVKQLALRGAREVLPTVAVDNAIVVE
jgi:hypothetical protein